MRFGAAVELPFSGFVMSVDDLEGDDRFELLTFLPFHDGLRVSTWTGSGVEGEGRQLLTQRGVRVVVVDPETRLPLYFWVPSSGGSPEGVRIGVDLMPEPLDVSALRPVHVSYPIAPSYTSSDWARLDSARHAFTRPNSGLSAMYRLSVRGSVVESEEVSVPGRFGGDVEGLNAVLGDLGGDGRTDFVGPTSEGYAVFESAADDEWQRRDLPAACRRGMLRNYGPVAQAVDLDRDGDQDLILNLVCEESDHGYITALREGEEFAFTQYEVLAEVAAVGDLDGDCAPDLFLSNGSYQLNDGVGGFLSPVQLAPPAGPRWDVSLADVDSDGDQDLIWEGDPMVVQLAEGE